MKSRLRGHPNYAQMDADYDVFLIVRTTHVITFKFEGHNNQAHALHNTKKLFYIFRQGKEVSNPQFLELFQSKVSTVEHFVGSIGTNPGLILAEYLGIAADLSNPTEDETELAALLARESYFGVAMLCVADLKRYKNPLQDLV